jgi:hypothetical protein
MLVRRYGAKPITARSLNVEKGLRNTMATILLAPGTPPANALGIAQRVLEAQGYTWTQTDDRHAEAQERGDDKDRGIIGSALDMRLRMSLTVESDALDLKKVRTVMSTIGAPGLGSGPSHTSKALDNAEVVIRDALTKAGLARS